MRIISLDSESYGSCKEDAWGRAMPKQTHFHPERSLLIDKPPLESFILCVSLTQMEKETPGDVIDLDTLCSLEPGNTQVMFMHKEEDVGNLVDWLLWADVIIGANLLYDLTVLRKNPKFARCLNGRHTIIDFLIVNYLHNELRSQRSLKTLGHVTRRYVYESDRKNSDGSFEVFEDPYDPKFSVYAASDTHNCVLGTQELAKRIKRDYPGTFKLSPYCIKFYSDSIWTAVRMMEAGIPLSYSKLSSLEDTLQQRTKTIYAELAEQGLIVSGEGSVASKRKFLEECMDLLPPEALGPLNFTTVEHALSTDDKNRLYLHNQLTFHNIEGKHRDMLAKWAQLSKDEKLLSAYTYPLLRHKRNYDPSKPYKVSKKKKSPFAAVAFPYDPEKRTCSWSPPKSAKEPSNDTETLFSFLDSSPSSSPSSQEEPTRKSDILIAFPRIYLFPGSFKDDSSDSGGQYQARWSFQDPGVTTFPRPVKKTITSRFGKQGSIYSRDASQVELRVAAIVSGEPSLLAAFNNNIDPHATRAVEIYKLPTTGFPQDWNITDSPGNLWFKEKYDKERQCAKHDNFTQLNLGGAEVLQTTILKKGGLHVPLEWCQQAVASRETSRPVLYKWQQEVVAKARRDGRIELPLIGQSRFFGPNENPSEIVNLFVQAIAANMTIRVTHHLNNLLPSINEPDPPFLMFCNWYDGILFDTLTAYIPVLDNIFEKALKLAIEDYWEPICAYYGNYVPISYSRG